MFVEGKNIRQKKEEQGGSWDTFYAVIAPKQIDLF